MKNVTLFYLTNCPYCHNAKRALDELFSYDQRYSEIEIKWIEESQESEFAAQYDYYYVPTVYFGDKKLYEADPSEDYADCKLKLKSALDTVLHEK